MGLIASVAWMIPFIALMWVLIHMGEAGAFLLFLFIIVGIWALLQ